LIRVIRGAGLPEARTRKARAFPTTNLTLPLVVNDGSVPTRIVEVLETLE
jgi:hypothetical protein